ncbi:putative glutathione reductase 2 [Toxocara canis]|uniref:Putative glutathione reductase 2 n=1 Tax=Toxocara canis TaxID=6265 RepID=A0A0B2UWT7_TOXCA|nr:putative glutathione reductase 2 [Toxocara canis]
MKRNLITFWARTSPGIAQSSCYQKRCFSSPSESGLYDAIVIGGGSGGLAFSKEAAQLGAKVALVDAVEPSPHGTTWGIGGTCVNVGCIPKKLMHQAALIGRFVEHAHKYGWNEVQRGKHDWSTLVNVVQDRIKASNWIYRVQLNEKKVDYINAFASFLDASTIKTVSAGRRKVERILRAKKFVIAAGLRPKYPLITGAELGITSDDIFSLRRPPGKTLVVGSSYVGLECAGFLRGLSYDVHLMIRSIPLRHFDQQCAEIVVGHMAAEGVKILRHFVPLSVEKQSDGRLNVMFRETNGTETKSHLYDTVIWATGREPRLRSLRVQNLGIAIAKSGKLIVNDHDETSQKNIYAIGDISEGRPELTPPAIKAGQLLARRLFAGSETLMRYDTIPTTVFTPLEYGAVGLPEEVAIERYGENNVEASPLNTAFILRVVFGSSNMSYASKVFHAYYVPYEYVVPQDESSAYCYAKLIALRRSPKTVLGLHLIGPNAAEIVQGFTSAISIKISSEQLFDTLPIHPCSAEEIVKMTITKRSGGDPKVVGCCG